MVLNGIGWYWMVLDGIGWYWMAFEEIWWYWMVLDGTGWYWMDSNGQLLAQGSWLMAQGGVPDLLGHSHEP